MRIVKIKKSHWPKIAHIYQMGIDTKNATFEEKLPDWAGWDRQHLKKCRLAALVRDYLAGFTALSPYSSRLTYQGVAEVSLYVSEYYREQGIGYRLLQEVITCSENEKIWMLQAGIFPENKTSIQLFRRCGFRTVGIREKIGQMNGIWRDVVLLERRSPSI